MACSFLDSWLCESGITTTTQLNPLLCTFTVLVRGAAVYEADRYQSRDGRRGLARCPQKTALADAGARSRPSQRFVRPVSKSPNRLPPSGS